GSANRPPAGAPAVSPTSTPSGASGPSGATAAASSSSSIPSYSTPLLIISTPIKAVDKFLDSPDKVQNLVNQISPTIDKLTGATAATLFNNPETRAALRGMQAEIGRTQVYPAIQMAATGLKVLGAVNTFVQETQN